MKHIAFLLIVLACFTFSAGKANSQVFSPKRLTSLPEPRQMHGSAVVGKRLYIFGGGFDALWTNTVISAEIMEDGTLSAWRDETPLPENRHYIGQSVEVINDRIYIVGGATAVRPDELPETVKMTDTVLFTRVKPDGRLEPWKKSPSFVTGRMATAATCSSDQHLYVVGGTDPQNEVHNRVVIADIQPETGDPVNVRQTTPLPRGLWFHGAAVMDNRMFVWGGLSERASSSASGKVYVAELDATGAPKAWRESVAVPQGVYSCAFSGFNDHLVSIAGRYVNGVPTNDIWYAKTVNGVVQDWVKLATDLDTRMYHSLGLDRTRGWIFVNGGRYRQGGPNGPTHLSKEVAGFRLGTEAVTPQAKAASAALPTLDSALQKAKVSKRPVLAYFYSSDVPACSRFHDAVLKPQLSNLAQTYEVAAVDSSKDAASGYKYRVFRVPSLAVIGPDGAVKKTSTRLLTDAEMQSFLKQ